jgi:hypothetical protein
MKPSRHLNTQSDKERQNYDLCSRERQFCLRGRDGLERRNLPEELFYLTGPTGGIFFRYSG